MTSYPFISSAQLELPVQLTLDRLYLNFHSLSCTSVTQSHTNPTEPYSTNHAICFHNANKKNLNAFKDNPTSSGTTQHFEYLDEILAFRVVGQLTVENRLICDPVYSRLVHFETSNLALNPQEDRRTKGYYVQETCEYNKKKIKYFLKKNFINLLDQRRLKSNNWRKSSKILNWKESLDRCCIQLSCGLRFACSISDLPLNAVLNLFIFCIDFGFLVAYGSVPLFGNNGIYQSGSFLVPLTTSALPSFRMINNSPCFTYAANLKNSSRNFVGESKSYGRFCYKPSQQVGSFFTSQQDEDLVCLGRLLSQNYFNRSKSIKRCKIKYKEAKKQRSMCRLCLTKHLILLLKGSEKLGFEAQKLDSFFSLKQAHFFDKGIDSCLLPVSLENMVSSHHLSVCDLYSILTRQPYDENTCDVLQKHKLLSSTLASPSCQSCYPSTFPTHFPLLNPGTKDFLHPQDMDSVTAAFLDHTASYSMKNPFNVSCHCKPLNKRRHWVDPSISLKFLKQAILAALSSYRNLYAVSQDKSIEKLNLRKIYNKRLEKICKTSLKNSLQHVGYLALQFPNSASPVLFSRQCSSDMCLRSRKMSWNDVQSLFLHGRNLQTYNLRGIAAQNVFPQSFTRNGLGKCLLNCEKNYVKVKQQLEDLQKDMCRWFLKTWSPLNHSFWQSLLSLIVQRCSVCRINRVNIHSLKLSDKMYTHPVDWGRVFYTILHETLENKQIRFYCNDCSQSSEYVNKHGVMKGVSAIVSELCQFGNHPMQYYGKCEKLYPGITSKQSSHQTTSREKKNSEETLSRTFLRKEEIIRQNNTGVLSSSAFESLMKGSIELQHDAPLSYLWSDPQSLQYHHIKRALYLASLPEPTLLTLQDKKLVWRCRHILKSKRVGLSKLCDAYELFKKNEINEEKKHMLDEEFSTLLQEWSTPSLDSVLELLCPLSRNVQARYFAIKALEPLGDRKLVLWIPQLVQALRYEAGLVKGKSLFNFLLERCLCSPLISSLVYWNLVCQTENSESSHFYCKALSCFTAAFVKSDSSHYTKQIWKILQDQKSLVESLRHIASQIHGKWDRAESKTLRLQEILITKTTSTPAFITTSNDGKTICVDDNNLSDKLPLEKKEQGDKGVCDHSKMSQPSTQPNVTWKHYPIPLPISPHYHFLGIVPEKSYIMRSSQYPLLLAFRILKNPNEVAHNVFCGKGYHNVLLDLDVMKQTTDEDNSYAQWFMSEKELKALGYIEEVKLYLYKTGDDLRQDQLVMQFISLCDTILCNYGCENCLMEYHVTAFSKTDGMIEFIENSQPISSLKRTHLTLKRYFHCLCDKKPGFPYDKVLDTFIKSCSAYCVVTFLLGVGDRHLDNILVTDDGHLFHVDFGFILDDDPKPFRPPMKLCREMIEALGGPGSKGYEDFQLYCCQYFFCFRRHAKMIMAMLVMMVDSGIRALRRNPSDTVAKVRERFQLNLSEPEAEAYLLNIISISAGALIPAVVDKLHEWAVYWK